MSRSSFFLVFALLALSVLTARVPLALVEAVSADWLYDGGSQDGAEFGFSVGTAGDVNGDGFVDVIVGAPQFTRQTPEGVYREGAAFIFLGSDQGLDTTPNWVMGSEQQGSAFGAAVGTAGDVNGDGYADLIIGAPEFKVDFGLEGEPKSGAVFVYYGSETGSSLVPDWFVLAEAPEICLGAAVATAGDVNHDGYDDVIIGAPLFDGGQNSEGKAYVYLGSAAGLATSPLWSYEGNDTGAGFGQAVAGGADLNADGYADIVIGAPYYANTFAQEGAAFVFFGSSAGPSTYANWIGYGQQEGAWFGMAVALGDANGDGYADAFVGAPQYDVGQVDDNRGAAFAFFGRDSKTLGTSDWQVTGPQVGDGFGHALNAAGDANGDGIADVVVGAYRFGENGGEDDQPNEGAVYLYTGSPLGISPEVAWEASGGKADAWFGYSVSLVEDINGDGKADLVVGAPTYRFDEKTVMGRAFGYLASLSVDADSHYSVYLPILRAGTE